MKELDFPPHRIKLIIPGNPIAKKRPRFFRRGDHVGTYNVQQTEEGRFQLEVERQIKEQQTAPFMGPIGVRLLFFFERPKSHFGSGKNSQRLKPSAPTYPSKKPDIDNCEKFVLDCLNKLVWVDDAQVVEMRSIKCYGSPPWTGIEIYRMEERGFITA